MDEYHDIIEVAYFADGGSGNAAKDAKMRGLIRVCKFAQGTICSITACKIHATSRASTHICRRPYRASHQETLGLQRKLSKSHLWRLRQASADCRHIFQLCR